MKREQTRTKILRILTWRTKDLPRKKRYLYGLVSFLFLFCLYTIYHYMFFILSKRWSYFYILAMIYCVALLIIIFIIDKEAEKLDKKISR